MPELTTRTTRRSLSYAATTLLFAFTALAPSASQATCGPANPWFQPSTVEKGYEFLVTGTGVGHGTFLIFSFYHQTAYPPIVKRYMTGDGNGNCVVNQEYVDTSNFKKGDWTVIAETYDGTNGEGSSFFLNPLSVVAPSTPAPTYPVYCGQTAHAWFGPNPVGRNQQMFIAAVARPGTHVDFYFEPPFPSSMRVLRINAGSNCVANQLNFTPAQQQLPTGTYDVNAGYWDEIGEYHYVSLGPITVNP
jgi:hypothetical protein